MAKKTGRKITDHAEANKLIEEWLASGIRMSDWCGKRELNWYSLNAHWGRGGAKRAMVKAEPAFVELAVSAPEITIGDETLKPEDQPSEATYRVCIGENLAIEVNHHFG